MLQLHDQSPLGGLSQASETLPQAGHWPGGVPRALGQPTWLLLDSRLDWRWGLTDTESLWSPNARLFRQSAAGVGPRRCRRFRRS